MNLLFLPVEQTSNAVHWSYQGVSVSSMQDNAHGHSDRRRNDDDTFPALVVKAIKGDQVRRVQAQPPFSPS